MITIRDWIPTIPDADKHIAYVGEEAAEIRTFFLTGAGWETYRNWTFYLDMAFDLSTVTIRDSRQVVTTQEDKTETVAENQTKNNESATEPPTNSTETVGQTQVKTTATGKKETYTVENVTVNALAKTDVAYLNKQVMSDGVQLTWKIQAQQTQLPGKLTATLRAKGPYDEVKKSALMVFEVDPAVVATPAATVPRSLFEQMLDEMSTFCEIGHDQVQESAAKAAAAASSASAAGTAAEQAQEHRLFCAEAMQEAQRCAASARQEADEAETHAVTAADSAAQAQTAADTATDRAAAAMESSIAAQRAAGQLQYLKDVADCFIIGKNLYDPDAAHYGYKLSLGRLVESEEHIVTDYILYQPVEGTCAYCFSADGVDEKTELKVAVYDASFTLLRQGVYSADAVIRIDQDDFDKPAAYLRMEFPRDLTRVQIEEGEIPTAYEPYQPPRLKAECVESGGYITPQLFGAKGDGVTDDTESINAALAAHNNVYFPPGTYLVDGTYDGFADTANGGIRVNTNQRILMDKDCIIQVKDNPTGYYNAFSVSGTVDTPIENVVIEGGKIVGNKTDPKTGHTQGYGISFTDSKNCTVRGVEIADMFADGIVIHGSTGDERTGRNTGIVIDNCVIHDCNRQGISIIIGDHITLRDVEIYAIGGKSPQSGIDIEPNNMGDGEPPYVHDVLFDNVHIYGTESGSVFYSYCYNITFKNMRCEATVSAVQKAHNIIHENCYYKHIAFHGDVHDATVSNSIVDFVFLDGAPSVKFNNCTMNGTAASGVGFIVQAPAFTGKAVFENCRMVLTNTEGTTGRYLVQSLATTGENAANPDGTFVFKGCDIGTADGSTFTYLFNQPAGLCSYELRDCTFKGVFTGSAGMNVSRELHIINSYFEYIVSKGSVFVTIPKGFTNTSKFSFIALNSTFNMINTTAGGSAPNLLNCAALSDGDPAYDTTKYTVVFANNVSNKGKLTASNADAYLTALKHVNHTQIVFTDTTL